MGKSMNNVYGDDHVQCNPTHKAAIFVTSCDKYQERPLGPVFYVVLQILVRLLLSRVSWYQPFSSMTTTG